jgi:hypothetical protein
MAGVAVGFTAESRRMTGTEVAAESAADRLGRRARVRTGRHGLEGLELTDRVGGST